MPREVFEGLIAKAPGKLEPFARKLEVVGA